MQEMNTHPGSDYVTDAKKQYKVECLALADRNMNLPCKTVIRYPTLTVKINRRDIMWQISVQSMRYVCTMQCMHVQCMYQVNVYLCNLYFVCTLYVL